jgi:hypothetical protein
MLAESSSNLSKDFESLARMDQIVLGSSRHIYLEHIRRVDLISTKKNYWLWSLAQRSNSVEKAVFSTPAEKISKYVHLIVVVGMHPPSSFYPGSEVISVADFRFMFTTQNTLSLKTATRQ